MPHPLDRAPERAGLLASTTGAPEPRRRVELIPKEECGATARPACGTAAPPPHNPAREIVGIPARWSLRSRDAGLPATRGPRNAWLAFWGGRDALPHAGSWHLQVAAKSLEGGASLRLAPGKKRHAPSCGEAFRISSTEPRAGRLRPTVRRGSGEAVMPPNKSEHPKHPFGFAKQVTFGWKACHPSVRFNWGTQTSNPL